MRASQGFFRALNETGANLRAGMKETKRESHFPEKRRQYISPAAFDIAAV
jgi:hypothetical protein